MSPFTFATISSTTRTSAAKATATLTAVSTTNLRNIVDRPPFYQPDRAAGGPVCGSFHLYQPLTQEAQHVAGGGGAVQRQHQNPRRRERRAPGAGDDLHQPRGIHARVLVEFDAEDMVAAVHHFDTELLG